MAFSRDDVASYEKQAPAQVPDTIDPFNPNSPVEATASAATTSPPDASGDLADGSPDNTAAPVAEVETKVEATTTETPAVAEADPVETDDVTPEADEGTTPPKRNGAQERIAELVAERNALKKYNEYLYQHVAAPKPEVTAAPAPPVVDEVPPTLEQHNFDPVAFAKAQNDWLEKRAERLVETRLAQREAQMQATNLQQQFTDRVDNFRKETPDFDVVMANPALPALHQSAARAVIQAEQGPQIAYHLARNPDVAARISRMAPEQQIMAIGRIDAQLTTSKAVPSKTAPVPQAVTPKVNERTVTKAPPPPKPVSASPSVVGKPDHLLTMEEFAAKDRERKVADREARNRVRASMRSR